MLKKLTSLLLSFLLCLSLLPGHAYAANESDLPQPPVIEEPLGPEPPEEPVMVMRKWGCMRMTIFSMALLIPGAPSFHLLK